MQRDKLEELHKQKEWEYDDEFIYQCYTTVDMN